MITASQLSMLVLGLGLICVVSMALHMRHERTLKRVEALEQRSEELEASLVTLVARSTSAAPAPGTPPYPDAKAQRSGTPPRRRPRLRPRPRPRPPRDSVRAANPAPAPAR